MMDDPSKHSDLEYQSRDENKLSPKGAENPADDL
jgi:hypothetical protein